MEILPRNLLIGESHNDPAARQYVAAHAQRLKDEGYVYFCYEMESTAPLGDLFGLDSGMTMQQILDYVHAHLNEPKTETVLAKIEKKLDAYLAGHGEGSTGLGILYRKVLEAGLRIVCIDYATKKLADQKPSDEQNRVVNFDVYAIPRLAELEHPWILITGAHHLANLQVATGAEIRDFSSQKKRVAKAGPAEKSVGEAENLSLGMSEDRADALLSRLNALSRGEQSSEEESSEEDGSEESSGEKDSVKGRPD